MMRRDAARAGLDETAHRAVVDTAEEFARDWRCPAAGCAPGPLDREHASLARHAARVIGLDEEPATCPFACLMSATEWTRELTRAAAIAAEFHTPLTAVLGRDLTPADLEALDTMLRAKADAWESDQAIIEREREAAKTGRG